MRNFVINVLRFKFNSLAHYLYSVPSENGVLQRACDYLNQLINLNISIYMGMSGILISENRTYEQFDIFQTFSTIFGISCV